MAPPSELAKDLSVVAQPSARVARLGPRSALAKCLIERSLAPTSSRVLPTNDNRRRPKRWPFVPKRHRRCSHSGPKRYLWILVDRLQKLQRIVSDYLIIHVAPAFLPCSLI